MSTHDDGTEIGVFSDGTINPRRTHAEETSVATQPMPAHLPRALSTPCANLLLYSIKGCAYSAGSFTALSLSPAGTGAGNLNKRRQRFHPRMSNFDQ